MYEPLELKAINTPHGMCKLVSEKCTTSMSTVSNALNGKVSSKKALECRRIAIGILVAEETFHIYNPGINPEDML